ncbi:MAG: DUF1987 domain-containing protein [Flavobacteriaceae bacterium]|nr:DUF1987 domain-containing protein [Flavobacteriaceae bacterium]PCJ26311.1 MAG: nuclear pore complex subunit [Flavobacteriales bacterium]
MEVINIKGTEHTPRVVFDHNSNKFEIRGDSRPENARQFYEPLIKWLDDYNKYIYWIKEQGHAVNSIDFIFNLEYFNSTSAKFLLDIFLQLKEFNKESDLFKVKWHYDEMDTDMKESGEEFELMVEMKFEYIINS